MSSMSWYSGPVSYGARYLVYSITWYIKPEFPPGEIFHSHSSSKLAKSRSVTMSPPISGPPVLPKQVSIPSTTTQLPMGPLWLKAFQPSRPTPSNRDIHSDGFSVAAGSVACCVSFPCRPQENRNAVSGSPSISTRQAVVFWSVFIGVGICLMTKIGKPAVLSGPYDIRLLHTKKPPRRITVVASDRWGPWL